MKPLLALVFFCLVHGPCHAQGLFEPIDFYVDGDNSDFSGDEGYSDPPHQHSDQPLQQAKEV